jgi:hypothetical protein
MNVICLDEFKSAKFIFLSTNRKIIQDCLSKLFILGNGGNKRMKRVVFVAEEE